MQGTGWFNRLLQGFWKHLVNVLYFAVLVFTGSRFQNDPGLVHDIQFIVVTCIGMVWGSSHLPSESQEDSQGILDFLYLSRVPAMQPGGLPAC